MADLLSNLNDEQRHAVTLPAQHALILAGAGSGKTRVLTTRLAWLVQTGQVGPQQILAVTFTNKAAKQMLARLAALFPTQFSQGARRLWIGTFHGLCNKMLRMHYGEAGLPQLFQILDSADQLAAVKRLYKNLNLENERLTPRELVYFINAQKEAGLRPAQVEAWDDPTRRKVALYQEYENQCRRESVVDFAELLLRCYELLQNNEPLRLHYQQRFRHILVDEFQDTNRLQYLWLKLLAAQGQEGGGCLFCVGDDDQSIYRFRGAEVGNMRDFEREFQVQNLIRLERNYRSYGNILSAANSIISYNTQRLGKNLWTDTGAGEPVRMYEAYSDTDEARWIVEEVQGLVRDGMSRSDIALLYRSNAQSRVLEHQLFTVGVPYRVYGGLRFFDRQEIKHALAYLRLLANPDDDSAFLRVVNFPTRGIGARSLEALQDEARRYNSSLYAAVAHVGGKAGKVLGGFVSLIEACRQSTARMNLPERVEHVLEVSGLREHYRQDKEGQERLENLDELVNAAASFVVEAGLLTEVQEDGMSSAEATQLAEFLAHASLEAGDYQADADSEAVQLMTVHAAKGLEFHAVFVSGLEEGLFPHENSMLDQQSLEEERRLMYVAVTRARERLYLSYAQSRMLHGQTHYNPSSRFIKEIPEELTKWLSARKTFSAMPGGSARSAPSAADAAGRPRMVNGFRVGQQVSHPRFGQGVIVAAEGHGQDARVQVNFGAEGSKWLLLSVAKLTAL